MNDPIGICCICPLCGAWHIVTVEFEDYCLWEEGESAQYAFPYLSKQELEYIITGICEDCWPK